MADEVDMICKDMFGFCSRLFNHRAVLQAECKFFVRELELKKSRDSSKVFLDIALSTEKTKSLIPDCGELLQGKVQKLHAIVVSAASSGMDVLNNRSTEEEKQREEYKTKREAEWDKFMIEMSKARTDVLQKHEEQMNELHTCLEVKS